MVLSGPGEERRRLRGDRASVSVPKCKCARKHTSDGSLRNLNAYEEASPGLAVRASCKPSLGSTAELECRLAGISSSAAFVPDGPAGDVWEDVLREHEIL